MHKSITLLLSLAWLAACGTSNPGPQPQPDAGVDAGPQVTPHDDPRLGAPYALLTALQQDLPAAADKEARVDDFLAEVEAEGGAPLRDGTEVYFLYRGSGTASVSGDWNGWRSPGDAMLAVQGTRLQVVKERFGDGERHLYKIVVDGNYLEDPLDPWVVWDGIDPGAGLGAFNGVVTMGHHALTEGVTHRETFSSFIEGNTRDVFVHLPPQYFATDDRLPSLYNQDGREALTKGQFDARVQAAIDDATATPLVLVTVALDDQNQRGDEYVWDLDAANTDVAPDPRGDAYVRLLADELVPFIDSHYRTLADPADRAVAGQSLGGLISAYAAYQRPEVFGQAACQSGSLFWNSNEMIQKVESGAVVPVRWYLDSGTGSGGSDDNYPVTEQMWQALDARGYVETHVTEPGGTHDWPHWSGRYANIPRTFFPR